MRKTALFPAAVAMAGVMLVAGCATEADTVSENIAIDAEGFKVQRKITGVNGITDAIAFEVEGKCSFERGDRALDVTCKHGPDDFRKHTIGLGDNTYWVSEQIGGVDVDEYRTTVLIRPETAIPNFDVETSVDVEGDGD